jgi:hypothetical protein
MPDLHGWISDKVTEAEIGALRSDDASTVGTLRRCAADRKILAIHAYSGGSYEPYACDGCGSDDIGALVDHANDCATLQALAEGYGITDDELARLDRPEEPRRDAAPTGKSALQVIDEFLWAAAATRRSTTPTSAVPAALRGPNWKATP